MKKKAGYLLHQIMVGIYSDVIDNKKGYINMANFRVSGYGSSDEDDKSMWRKFRDFVLRRSNAGFADIESTAPTADVRSTSNVIVLDETNISVDGRKYTVAKPDSVVCPTCDKTYTALNENGLCFHCDRAFNRHLYYRIQEGWARESELAKKVRNFEIENSEAKNKVYLLSMMLKAGGEVGVVETVNKIINQRE